MSPVYQSSIVAAIMYIERMVSFIKDHNFQLLKIARASLGGMNTKSGNEIGFEVLRIH